MDPGVVALSFVPIFLVELPDKTFVAALVLSTRYRPLPVWLGIGAAFASSAWWRLPLGTSPPCCRRPCSTR
jgi:putative Ca2+/H+ antiporter (TMEM165/GDT1 family)